MTRFCKGVRAGDEWVFQTNSGGISRIIVGFDDETVFYRGYGDIHEKRCKAATFNRWLKGARLEFRRPDGVQGLRGPNVNEPPTYPRPPAPPRPPGVRGTSEGVKR